MVGAEKKDWDIDDIQELFTEWYFIKDGHVKGMKKFLEDQKLNKIFSVQNYKDLMNKDLELPMSLAASLANASPFEIDVYKMGYLIKKNNMDASISARMLEVDDKNLEVFAEFTMSYEQVMKHREEAGLTSQELRKSRDHKEKKALYAKIVYMLSKGESVIHMTDEEIENYDYGFVKKTPEEIKKKKNANKKKQRLKRKGFDVKGMSYDEIEELAAEQHPTAEQVRRNLLLRRKRHKLKTKGINTSIMTKEQIESYGKRKSLTKKDRYLYIKTFQKKQRVKKHGIDITDMSDDEIRAISLVKELSPRDKRIKDIIYARRVNFKKKDDHRQFWSDEEILALKPVGYPKGVNNEKEFLAWEEEQKKLIRAKDKRKYYKQQATKKLLKNGLINNAVAGR